jgi:hypothetical protein
MHRRILLTIALALISSLIPGNASAALYGTLKINNPTDKFVWVTVYTANVFSRWGIVRADCIAPKGNWNFRFSQRNDNEVKIRAEVKHGDCRSGNISDTSDVRKDLGSSANLEAEIFWHQNRGFFIAFL